MELLKLTFAVQYIAFLLIFLSGGSPAENGETALDAMIMDG